MIQVSTCIDVSVGTVSEGVTNFMPSSHKSLVPNKLIRINFHSKGSLIIKATFRMSDLHQSAFL